MKGITPLTLSMMPAVRQSHHSPVRDFADELDEHGKSKRGAQAEGADARSYAYSRDRAHVMQLAEMTGGVDMSPASVISSGEMPMAESGDRIALVGTQSAQPLDVVVQPKGVTESFLDSRVFGVHLLAGTYLSELHVSTEHGSAQAFPGLAACGGYGGQGETIGRVSEAFVSAQSVSGNSWRSTEEDLLAILVRKALEMMTDEIRSPNQGEVLPEATQEAIWPAESLRLTKRADGSLTLWLRDFRLDEDGMRQTVGVLVKEAGAKGIHLGRIVFNGREAWRSPTFTKQG